MRTGRKAGSEVMGKIVSINVSSRKRIPKSPVQEAELVPGTGIAGDAHAAPGDRQLSLLMMESIERQRAVVEKRFSDGAAPTGRPARARPCVACRDAPWSPRG